MGILAVGAVFDISSTITISTELDLGSTYHYYACVDTDGGTNTSNNCSSSVERLVNPRLVLSTPSANPSSPLVSTATTFSVTITNEGNADAASGGSITYYRSDDATITSTDTSLGDGSSLDAIARGSSLSPSTDTTVPDTAGTYYYGACVSHDDNSSGTIICSSAASVQVVAVATPDLNLGSASAASAVPDAVADWRTFTFSITVQNTGTANACSDSGTITYYRSSDSTITSSDTEVSSESLPAISISGSSPQSVTITAPTILR